MSSLSDSTRFLNPHPKSAPSTDSTKIVSSNQPNHESTDFDLDATGSVASTLSASQELSLVALERYRIERLLGSGGFANVFKAYDLKLNRNVALKVLRTEGGVVNDVRVTDAKKTECLNREATVVSNLQHPHIVTLYDLQVETNPQFLVMEYIDGESLSDFLDRHPYGIDPNQAAEITLAIVEALVIAHANGILHRDIKPSNILLDPSRHFRNLKFCPRLADFGLARTIDQTTLSLSHVGFVGTIAYAPPELLDQNEVSYSERSDIYSLGCILYCLLTGGKPFKGNTFVETINRISEGACVPLRQQSHAIPRDLEAICNQAMALFPNDRYADSKMFSEDLKRFLDKKPVLARKAPLLVRSYRWMRRHFWLSFALASLMIAVVTISSVFAWSHSQLSRFNTALEDQNTQLFMALNTSKQANFRNEQIIYALDLREAADELEQGAIPRARAVLEKYQAPSLLAQHRDIDWYFLNRSLAANSKLLSTLPSTLYVGAWEPTLDEYYVGGANGHLFKIESRSSQVTPILSLGDEDINAVVWDIDPSDSWLSSDDGTVQRWDLVQVKKLCEARLPDPEVKAFNIVLRPEVDRFFVFASNDRLYCGSISEMIQDSEADQKLLEFAKIQLDGEWADFSVRSIAPGIDGRTLLVGTEFRSLLELDAADCKVLKAIDLASSEDELRGIAVIGQVESHPSTGLVACTTWDGFLKIVDMHQGQLLSTQRLPEPKAVIRWFDSEGDSEEQNQVKHVQGSSFEGVKLVTIGRQNSIYKYAIDTTGTPVLVNMWIGERERIFGALVDPVSKRLTTLAQSGRVRQWDISGESTDLPRRVAIEEAGQWGTCVLWSQDSHETPTNHESDGVLCIKANEMVKAYPLDSSRPSVVLTDDCSELQIGRCGPYGLLMAGMNSLMYLPDSELSSLSHSSGSTVASRVFLWQSVFLPRESHPVVRNRNLILPAVSSDGEWLVGYDQPAQELWFARWGRDQIFMSIRAEEVSAVHYVEHDRSWWWGEREKMMRWQMDSSEPPQAVFHMDSYGSRITHTLDGRFVAVTASYGTCYVWSNLEQKLLDLPIVQSEEVHDLLFSKSGRTLMTLTISGLLSCWNLESGRCSYQDKASPIERRIFGGFSDDGNWLMRFPGNTGESDLLVEPLPRVE